MNETNINLDPDMAQGIEITLTDGRRYSLRDKHTLCDINEEQEAIFLFDNGEIYHGQSNGQVDDEGDFHLFKTGSQHGIALPFARLVAWAYEQPPRDPAEVVRERLRELARQASEELNLDLLSVRFRRDDDGNLTDIALRYEERVNPETENGNPQTEGERK